MTIITIINLAREGAREERRKKKPDGISREVSGSRVRVRMRARRKRGVRGRTRVRG